MKMVPIHFFCFLEQREEKHLCELSVISLTEVHLEVSISGIITRFFTISHLPLLQPNSSYPQ